MVAAAIVGAGVATAVGAGVSGSMAASATKSSTNAAINAQQQALTSQQALAQPYTNIGTQGGAVNQYEQLLGLSGAGAAAGTGNQSQNIQATLAQTPGYQFTLNQGLQSTQNQANAMGLGLSGNTLEGLDQYSSGLADQTYQQAVQNAQGAVGIGQAAAAGQAANIGAEAGNVSNALINQGQTTAGIDVNTIAGITKAGSNAVGQYATYNTLQGLINPSAGLSPYVPQAQYA